MEQPAANRPFLNNSQIADTPMRLNDHWLMALIRLGSRFYQLPAMKFLNQRTQCRCIWAVALPFLYRSPVSQVAYTFASASALRTNALQIAKYFGMRTSYFGRIKVKEAHQARQALCDVGIALIHCNELARRQAHVMGYTCEFSFVQSVQFPARVNPIDPIA
jgi:hypothetical protein